MIGLAKVIADPEWIPVQGIAARKPESAAEFEAALVNVRTIPCVSPTGTVAEMVPPLPPLATPADDRTTLVASPVCTEREALIMGQIRSIQTAGFSADNSAIDDDRQRAWWQQNRLRCNAWLYTFRGVLVGYSALLQQEDGRWVSSLAVLPGHEGRKFGGRMLSHLIASVDHEVYARARVENAAACALHNDREWEMTGEADGCRHYRTRPRVRVEVSLSGYDYAEPGVERACGWWMAENGR